MSRFLLVLILLVLGIVWGSTIPITKVVVSTGHAPLGLIVWQLIFSCILLGSLAVLRRKPLPLSKGWLIRYAIVTLTGTLLPNSFSYWSAFHLPAGVMALVIALVPMFTLMIALALQAEQFSLIRLTGVACGTLAVALLVLPETSLPDPAKAVFVLIALIAPFCYGIEGNYIARALPGDSDPVSVLLGASIIGTLFAIPPALATGSWVDITQPWSSPEWGLLASTILHVTAYCGYIWLVGRAGPVFSSQVGYIVTPAGVLLSAFFLSESYSGYIWLALLLIMTGLVLVQPKKETGAKQLPHSG